MMKLPKTIPICGYPYKLKIDPTHDGGSFDEGTHTIVIGTLTATRVPDILLHEVTEAVYAIRNLRYVTERGEICNGDYRFFFDHDGFEQATSDIAIALAGISFPKIGK